MSEIELKPFPWCGKPGTFIWSCETKNIAVICVNPSCSIVVETDQYPTRKAAALAWNTRAPEAK